MPTTLYAVYTSHPAHAARLMLEHKQIEHKLAYLPPGTHAAAVRALGFRSGTVPALKLDGRRIQGSRSISRALDEVKPEPRLFPADPRQRILVEEAERWGDEVLQPIPRRLGGWLFANRLELRANLIREQHLPGAELIGRAGRPVAWYFARKVDASDGDRMARLAATLPGVFDHVDGLIEAGTIGGEERNAADFQIGTSIRLLMSFADLTPLLEDRAAGRHATALMPDYPTGIPAGFMPPDWLVKIR